MKGTCAATLIAISLAFACSAKVERGAAPKPVVEGVRGGGAEEQFAALAAAAPAACDGAEIFGAENAFDCSQEVCVRAAHDRSEETCSPNCERFYQCTDPMVCRGSATLCMEPIVVEFKTTRCPAGVGYHCVGSCRCSCGCTQDA